MNNDLTISTLAFKLRANDIADGSERREVSRGVSTPTVMTVRSQDYVDSATKLPGVRTVLRFDRHAALADGRIAPITSAYLVVTRLKDANVLNTDVMSNVGHIQGVIDNTSPNLDLGTNLFVNGEQ